MGVLRSPAWQLTSSANYEKERVAGTCYAYTKASVDIGKSKGTLDKRVQPRPSFNICTSPSANCAGVSLRAVCHVLSVSLVWRVVGPLGRCRPGVSCGSVVVCPDARGFVQ